jgi:hypothetical protein
MDTVEINFHRPRSVGQTRNIPCQERIVVELGVASLGSPSRDGRRFVADPVELIKSNSMDHAVNRAAPVAAKLLILTGFYQSGGDG